jgi:hypothetical protein
MSGFIQNLLGDSPGNFLKGVAKGFFGNDYLRDYQHASKTFRSDSYAYAPKYKFLFHVYFDINLSLIGNGTGAFPTDSRIGLAVKNITLPSYSFDVHKMNQYNRKRIVQTKIQYDDINITFHDDNANLIRQLWYNYYTYYYKDATKTTVDYGSTGEGKAFDYNRRNVYDQALGYDYDWGYIGESSLEQQNNLAASLGYSKAPFFRSIKIYGFNQHNYVLYQLINPTLTSFKHDTYDYAQTNGTMEASMGVAYETVKYYQGAIDGRAITNGDPQNNPASDFAIDHYDKTPSPIMRPGANGTIIGQGGLADGAGGILSDLKNGNILGAIQKGGMSYQTIIGNGGIGSIINNDIRGVVNDSVRGTPNRSNTFNFPVFGSSK